jgi:hypothetical protein
MNDGNISFEITELFGIFSSTDSTISLSDIKKIQTAAWQGDLCSLPCRPICWRFFFRFISNNKSNWKNELIKQVEDYKEIKKNIIPSFDKVASSVDPLQSFLNINDSSDSADSNWQSYYKSMELSNFIKGDLDRLYMTGIDDEYFQSDKRRSQLLSILLIWSLQNKNISYRQGMHEIIGPILMCVEAESDAWILENKKNSIDKHILSESFTSNNIEAYSYWLFNRIMVELKPLYDPTPSASVKASEPAVVHYCTKIQEHFLRDLDPVLCKHLEDNFIPAQLYGMRWSRLLLGREFPVSHSHCLKLWDYMFATVRDDDEFIPIYNNNNELASHNNILSNNEKNKKDLSPSMQPLLKSRYGPYSPLLSALGDFILAMLLNIRDDLVEADSSDSMRLLLRYPEQIDIRSILDYADMIRRGVLTTGAHIYTPPKVLLKPTIKPTTISTPSWLSKSQPVSIISKSGNVLQNIGQKVEKMVTNVTHKSNDSIKHSIIDPLKELNDKTVSFVENSTELLLSNDYFVNEDGINCCKLCKNQLNQFNNSINAVIPNVETTINIENNKEDIFNSNINDNSLTPLINESSSSSWFPLSMSKSAVKSERKNRPSSGGFDLPIRKNFGFNDDDDDDGNEEESNNNNINRGENNLSKKSNVDILLDKNNLIGNRLLDMADDILKPVSSAQIESISDKQKELNNIEFNKSIARKLRILADVLGGLSSLDEYDEKFNNDQKTIITKNSYIKPTSSPLFSSNSEKNIKKIQIITDDNPLFI